MPNELSPETQARQAEVAAAPVSRSSSPVRVSPWAPLRQPVYRTIWIGTLISNIGTWMQSVGAGWEMTNLAPSPLFVALVSSASTLPVFFLAYPSGVLADQMDRRRYIIGCQLWMMAVAIGLTLLAGFDALTAWNLLALTFLMGVGMAMNGPAWQAIVPEIAGKDSLPQAIALNSAGFNVARTIGPSIGGMIYGLGGAVLLFAANAATFVGVLGAMALWRRAKQPPPDGESGFWAGFAAGYRHIRADKALLAILARAFCFFWPAAALLPLLPLVARHELQLDSFGYGMLSSAFGGGAVLGAFLLPAATRRLGTHGAVLLWMLIEAAALAAVAALSHPVAVGVAVAVGGAGWISVIATNNVAVQNRLPGWVRARGVAVYQMVFFGGIAFGGAIWGQMAASFGVRASLGIAAATLALATLVANRFRPDHALINPG